MIFINYKLYSYINTFKKRSYIYINNIHILSRDRELLDIHVYGFLYLCSYNNVWLNGFHALTILTVISIMVYDYTKWNLIVGSSIWNLMVGSDGGIFDMKSDGGIFLNTW